MRVMFAMNRQKFDELDQIYSNMPACGFLPYKGHLEFSGAFFLPEIFERVSFSPYNFRITSLSARKSEQMKNF